MSKVDLSGHDSRGYTPGRPYWFRATWLVIEAVTLLNPLFVSYRLKAYILRLFGASIGMSPVIKPGVHIKYPWRLSVGDYVWLATMYAFLKGHTYALVTTTGPTDIWD
jgi:putative colanic acid biosynthesis acetyltransferase WcaF